MTTPIREARLRPEFAHLYPYLHAGAWAPAARTAGAIIERLRQAGVPPGVDLDARIMSEAHFEFRGGSPEAFDRTMGSRLTIRDCIGSPADDTPAKAKPTNA